MAAPPPANWRSNRITQAGAWRQSRDPLDGQQRRGRTGPAGNLKPAKDKSTERIDGIAATIGRALVAQEDDTSR
jgi:hypothetical protein